MLIIITFWASKPICGILFGFVFWSMVKHVKDSNIRSYLITSAFGIILLIIANQGPAIASSLSFPPYGTISLSYIGMSSYLLFIGIYYSVAMISYDGILKKSISILATKFNLWDSITTSESFLESEEKINKINNIMKEDQYKHAATTGIQYSVTDSEILDYINEILMEKQTKE